MPRSEALDVFRFTTKSPEQQMIEREEQRPRRYAKDIFRRYPEHARAAQVDRLVPLQDLELVRGYLREFAERERTARRERQA